MKVIAKSKKHKDYEAIYDLEREDNKVTLRYAKGCNWSAPGKKAYSVEFNPMKTVR